MKHKLHLWSLVIGKLFVRCVLLGILLDLEVSGIRNVPSQGPCILVCNHMSNLDPLIMLAYVRRTPIVLGKQELWGHAVLRPLLRWVRAIPVNRQKPSRETLRQMQKAVASGEPFGIFPEGTRMKGHALGRGFPGVGMMARGSRVPVIPMAVCGTQNVFSGGKINLRTKARFITGTPIRPEELADAGSAQAVTDLIMYRIAELLPPELRGVYREQGGLDEL